MSVNGLPARDPRQRLTAGDVVEVGPRRRPLRLSGGIELIYDDPEVLVVLKPSGLLTVATPHERDETLFRHLRESLRLSTPGAELYVVHRLDKFASGLLVFARSESVQRALRDLFARHDVERRYWAIVEGSLPAASGTLRSHLVEHADLKMRSTRDPGRGKLAVTHFRVLRRLGTLTALEVQLETGRKNQIRVQLSEAGHPIAGDRAYGSRTDPLGRLALHAFLLGFRHPRTGESLRWSVPPPPEFRRYLPRAAAP